MKKMSVTFMKKTKDKVDGVAIMRLVSACGLNSKNSALQILEEIEEYEYTTDSELVVFFREKIENDKLHLIAKKYSNKK
jgi:hypothetical protein